MHADVAAARAVIEALLFEPAEPPAAGVVCTEDIEELCVAALAAAAARHLAVARPRTLGLIGTSRRADLAARAHRELYTHDLIVRVAGASSGHIEGAVPVSLGRALACDIVCIDRMPDWELTAADFAPGTHLTILRPGPYRVVGAVRFGTVGDGRSLASVARGEHLGRTGAELTCLDANPTDAMRRAIASMNHRDET